MAGDGVLRHHAHVGGERELHRAADAGAVDLAIVGFGISSSRFHQLRIGSRGTRAGSRATRDSVRQRAEVHAGREHRPVAAHHDHANRVVGGRVLERVRRAPAIMLAVDRVALLRRGQDDVADRPAILDLD